MRGEPFLCADVENEEKYFRLDERVKSEMAAPLTEEEVCWCFECGCFGEECL